MNECSSTGQQFDEQISTAHPAQRGNLWYAFSNLFCATETGSVAQVAEYGISCGEAGRISGEDGGICGSRIANRLCGGEPSRWPINHSSHIFLQAKFCLPNHLSVRLGNAAENRLVQ